MKGEKDIILKFSAYNGWNTICLPFIPKRTVGSSYDHLQTIFGDGYKVYSLNAYSDGMLEFSLQQSGLEANTPYLVHAENASNSTQEFSLHADMIYKNSYQATAGGATFQGTYAPISMEGKYGVTGNATIQKGGENSNILGYRAYFTGVSEAPNGARPTIVFSEEEMPTGIGAVQMLENTKDVYNLNGQKVSQTHKGIYIVNGRKVVVK